MHYDGLWVDLVMFALSVQIQSLAYTIYSFNFSTGSTICCSSGVLRHVRFFMHYV